MKRRVSYKKRDKYWYTVAWDGEPGSEGSHSDLAYTYELMIECIHDYLKKYAKRGAYFETASLDDEKGKSFDLTERVKKEL